ncbi:MAG: leucyl aminopeptidase [Bacteroidia bacterium]
MSIIQLSKSKKAIPADRILLCNTSKDLEKSGLSDQELQYIKTEEKAGKKSLILNNYEYYSFIQFITKGKTDALTTESIRVCANSLLPSINSRKLQSIQLLDFCNSGDCVLAFCEGLSLGNYQFLKYKASADKDRNSLKKVKITSDKVSQKQIDELQCLTEAVHTSRDLVNEPLSYLTAVQLGKECEKLGKECGFKVDVLNKSKIEALKMGGLLAVNKGSIDPPAFIIMEYKPKNAKNKKPVVLVGKGVVYDTGGLSLKPSDGMMTMKCDMGGGAAVIGAIAAISKAEVPVWTVALVPATDNRPDGNAIVPGDIITISDGTTVEVLNTDAEGRLILSDALVYAKKFKPSVVIDLATLTGAASRAIGKYGIVAMGTAQAEFDELKQSGNEVHERLVEFPLWDEYGDMLKSDIADIKNIGGAIAGANTAGKFLERFTDYPWIHLDIAGPAFLDSVDSYRGKGGSGTGVRLLFNYLKKVSKA